MSSFTKTDRGLLIELNEAELSILRGAATEVLQIIIGRDSTELHDDPLSNMLEISTHDRLPEDPVLARLFPDAYQDERLSSEFRRYTENALQSKKSGAIDHLLSSLPISGIARVEIATEKIDLWIRAINDLRLVFGVVLSIDENSDKRFAQMGEDDPDFFRVQIFYWLGGLLENLVDHSAD